MAEELMHQAGPEAAQGQERVGALVRAIRRAHRSSRDYGGLEAFHVSNIHEFAARLVAEGVRTLEDAP